MSKRLPKVIVGDIIEAVNNCLAFCDGLDWDSFSSNLMVMSAVIRQLEIMGEASRVLPEEIKNLSPDIPWRKIIGMRNRVVHEYFDMSYETVWRVIQDDLPELKPQFEALLLLCPD